jgi:uncharacterized protein YegP (UPF0339 family)
LKEEHYDLELIEEYIYAGSHRYRFRLRGTNIVINVSAENLEDGVRKAIEIIKKSSIPMKTSDK